METLILLISHIPIPESIKSGLSMNFDVDMHWQFSMLAKVKRPERFKLGKPLLKYELV